MSHIVHVNVEITKQNDIGGEGAEVGEKGGEFINEVLVVFGWTVNSGYWGRFWSNHL